MPWLKRPRAAVIEDVSQLITPGWEVTRARIGHAPGGVVTLTVLNLRRVGTATGMTDLIAFPSRLAPTDHLYSTRTYRGLEVQFLSNGRLSINNPSTTSLDHLHLTYVPTGGA